MRSKRHTSNALHSKRTIIIIVISLVVLASSGIYTWQSLSAWKGYETRLKAEQASYAALKDKALNGDSIDARIIAVRGLDEKLESRDRLCKINPLFSWQAAIVPALKEGVQQCEDKVRQLDTVAVPLGSLRDYLDTLEKLQPIIQKLTPGEALNEANWTKNGLEASKQVRTELAALPAKGDAASLRDTSVGITDKLVKAWEGLLIAHQAKDKSAYLSSSAAVTKAYADFASLADISDARIQELVTSVTDAASKL